jgi:hypothetical protein
MSLVAGLTPGKSLGIHTEDRTYAFKTHAKSSREYKHQFKSKLPLRVKLLQTIVHDNK